MLRIEAYEAVGSADFADGSETRLELTNSARLEMFVITKFAIIFEDKKKQC